MSNRFSADNMTNILIQTNAGDITIELFTDSMPITAGNIMSQYLRDSNHSSQKYLSKVASSL
jgi:cyclophilin family peptidyl-prolyl cis-trans isomerase